jgi:hypothetical protein
MQVHPVTPACRALINIYTSGHRLSGRKADLIEPLLGRTREAV